MNACLWCHSSHKHEVPDGCLNHPRGFSCGASLTDESGDSGERAEGEKRFIAFAAQRRARFREESVALKAKHRNPTTKEHHRAYRVELESLLNECERDVDQIRAREIPWTCSQGKG